jgi:hypothetical protein
MATPLQYMAPEELQDIVHEAVYMKRLQVRDSAQSWFGREHCGL